jgi:hypothetical protein
MKETQPSAAGPLKGHDSAALARRIDSFDQRFEELLQGPAGTELRRAHLFEQLATRIFNGDYEKAQAALDTPASRSMGAERRPVRAPARYSATHHDRLATAYGKTRRRLEISSDAIATLAFHFPDYRQT